MPRANAPKFLRKNPKDLVHHADTLKYDFDQVYQYLLDSETDQEGTFEKNVIQTVAEVVDNMALPRGCTNRITKLITEGILSKKPFKNVGECGTANELPQFFDTLYWSFTDLHAKIVAQDLKTMQQGTVNPSTDKSKHHSTSPLSKNLDHLRERHSVITESKTNGSKEGDQAIGATHVTDTGVQCDMEEQGSSRQQDSKTDNSGKKATKDIQQPLPTTPSSRSQKATVVANQCPRVSGPPPPCNLDDDDHDLCVHAERSKPSVDITHQLSNLQNQIDNLKAERLLPEASTMDEALERLEDQIAAWQTLIQAGAVNVSGSDGDRKRKVEPMMSGAIRHATPKRIKYETDSPEIKSTPQTKYSPQTWQSPSMKQSPEIHPSLNVMQPPQFDYSPRTNFW